MNLIEQLGGYEKVKQMWVDGGSLQGTQLAFELLEYRRENNILEVGDSVFLAETGNEIQIVYESNKELFYNLGFRHATPQEIAQGYRDE